MFLSIRNPQFAIRNRAGGYTLIELMVVMVILVILVATALPLVKRVMDNDRVRETSRQLSAYISMAKVRAVQTGRPCGLLLMLDTPLGAAPAGPPYIRQCTRLFLAEVPPTYGGSTQGARGRIRSSLTGPAGTFEFYPIYYNSAAMMPGYEPDPTELAYLYTLINAGEQFLVRFDYKGPWYVCQRGIAGDVNGYVDPTRLYYTGLTIMKVPTPLPPGIILPPATEPAPSPNPGYFYQIMRSPQPVGEPLELTGGTCIDMTYSGAGPSGNGFILASHTLAMMFTPSGGVKDLYFDGSAPTAPDGTIHLLLGRVAKMNLPTGPSQSNPPHPSGVTMFSVKESNLADATSLWVSVGRANGTVTTSENVPDTSWSDFSVAGGANFLAGARSVATGREQMGGQ